MEARMMLVFRSLAQSACILVLLKTHILSKWIAQRTAP